MRETRAIALSLLALLGALALAAPASVAGPAAQGGPPGAAAVDAQPANESTMGGQVSSFMHSSSGQTDEEVQAGMWNAAYENASNRTQVVERRTTDIGSRLADLQAEKQALVEAKNNDSISQTEYRSRMSAVVGRMAALNRSITETERQAGETGVDPNAVQALRTQASNVTGPEIAEVARSMAGGPPEGVPGQAKGPGKAGQSGPPNGSQGPPNSSQGPPHSSQGNGSGQGPPGNDSGQGSNGNGGSAGNGGNGNGGSGGNGTDDTTRLTGTGDAALAPVRTT